MSRQNSYCRACRRLRGHVLQHSRELMTSAHLDANKQRMTYLRPYDQSTFLMAAPLPQASEAAPTTSKYCSGSSVMLPKARGLVVMPRNCLLKRLSCWSSQIYQRFHSLFPTHSQGLMEAARPHADLLPFLLRARAKAATYRGSSVVGLYQRVKL